MIVSVIMLGSDKVIHELQLVFPLYKVRDCGNKPKLTLLRYFNMFKRRLPSKLAAGRYLYFEDVLYRSRRSENLNFFIRTRILLNFRITPAMVDVCPVSIRFSLTIETIGPK